MKLYGYRNGRTLRVLWTLEEVGVTCEYIEVDVLHGEGQEPWFTELNPAGKVPVLVDEGIAITESAAICMHLADKYPVSGLLPGTGTPGRAQAYKWISFVLTELDAPLWIIAKHRFGLPKERRVAPVVETAAWEFGVAADLLAKGLAENHYLIGNALTVPDILAGHTLLWAKSARIPFRDPALDRYLERLCARNAYMRARDRTSPNATSISVDH